MKSKDLQGLFPALVTPVQNDEVDQASLKKLTKFLLENGSDGLVVLGGTGEYAALSKKQRINAVKVVQENAGDSPVIVGILDPGFNDAVEMGKISKEMGADAVMLITPYYVIPKQEGIINYYLRFMDKVDLPMIIYNIPYRTNVNIEPETVNKLSEQAPQVIGIKECTPNIGQAAHLMELTRDRISFLCGEEFLLFTELMMGADGAILATANIFPRIWKDMLLSVKSSNINKARDIYFKMLPLLRAVFAETNPGPLKAAMKYASIDAGAVLDPLSPPDDKKIDQLNGIIDEIREWYSRLN